MRYILAAALLLAILCAGFWDIYVTAKGSYGDTVSSILQSWSLEFPVLPLLIGILLGHIFWPQAQVAR